MDFFRTMFCFHILNFTVVVSTRNCLWLLGLPVVRFCSKKEMALKPERWVVKTGSGALLSRKQIPLRLAWAFSIHKSQVFYLLLCHSEPSFMHHLWPSGFWLCSLIGVLLTFPRNIALPPSEQMEVMVEELKFKEHCSKLGWYTRSISRFVMLMCGALCSCSTYPILGAIINTVSTSFLYYSS
jgi:hypothetical protein